MAMLTRVERIEAAVPVTVVALDGELDASNYLQLVDDVRQLYADGTRNLLLDLSDLSFIASSGLVALFSVVKVMNGEEPPDPEYGWGAFREVSRGVEAGAVQQNVQLCGAKPSIAEVLQRTGLDRLFVSHPDRESAVASY
jgi:anti-anti-sigma regulatory factor